MTKRYRFYHDDGTVMAEGTMQEVADELGIPKSTLQSRAYYGRMWREEIGKEKKGEVPNEYTIISSNYNNIQVIELPCGSRRVMSKRTGKLVDDSNRALFKKKLGSHRRRGVAND